MSIIRNLIENERGLHTNSVATDNELVLKQDKSTLLNALKAVDGAGSGLDADLVRGAEPVKLSTAGTELTKIDGSTIKNQCTAWVNFDGTDGTIRDSYNVSSVVRDATGKYTITFTNSMDNTNYVVSGMSRYVSTSATALTTEILYTGNNDEMLIDSLKIAVKRNYDDDEGFYDVNIVTIQVFGGKN